MTRAFLIFFYLPALTSLVPALGQSVTSITATPLVESGHEYITGLNEIVNPSTGSVSIRIPSVTPLERGINKTIYAYMYDSSGQIQLVPNWAYNASVNSMLLTSVSQYGNGMDSSAGGAMMGATASRSVSNNPGVVYISQPGMITSNLNTINTYVGGGPTTGAAINCQYNSGYVYTDLDGGRHDLDFTYVSPSYQGMFACGALNILSSTANGQGIAFGGDDTYRALIQGDGSITIYDDHGNRLNAVSGTNQVAEDTNGNTLHGTGRIYSQASGYSPMPTPLVVPGVSGSYKYTSTISYGSSSSTLQFGASLVGQQTAECPASFAGSPIGAVSGSAILTLPDNNMYTFTPDPSFGLMGKVSYPTGASVSYTWQMDPQSEFVLYSLPANTPAYPCTYRYGMPRVQRRLVSVNGSATMEQDFAYSTVWGSYGWVSKTTTVTTKDLLRGTSFDTVYSYVPGSGWSPLEQSIVHKASGGAVINTINETWGGGHLLSRCSTFSGGQMSGVFYQYAPRTSVVTDLAEYDYGLMTGCQQPSSPPPTRETVTAYQSFPMTPLVPATPSLSDRPSSVKVYGAGLLQAETDYSYDEYAVAPITPAPLAHDEVHYGPGATSPRGNVTSIVRKCLLGGGAPCTSDSITNYWYDETGQVVQTQDGNRNTTKYSYADSFTSDDGAPPGKTNTYLTTVIRPPTNDVQHIENYQYGYNQGKLRQVTDENSQITNYTYADTWGRLTATDAPAAASGSRPHTQITYVDGPTSPSRV